MKYEIELYESGNLKKLTIYGVLLTFKGKFSYNKNDGFIDERCLK